MYDDILFPADGSENAERAFEHALSLVERYDAMILRPVVVNTPYTDIGATGRVDDDRLAP